MAILASHAFRSKSKTLQAARSAAFCDVVSCYEAPFGRAEAAQALRDLGVDRIDSAALPLVVEALASENPLSRRRALEKLAIYAREGALGPDDVRACLSTDASDGSEEIVGAILLGRPDALLSALRRRQSDGGDISQFLILLGRALNDIRQACRRDGAVFWKTQKTVQQAAAKISNIEERAVSAALELHRLELSIRRSEPLADARAERAMLRISRMFGR